MLPQWLFGKAKTVSGQGESTPSATQASVKKSADTSFTVPILPSGDSADAALSLSPHPNLYHEQQWQQHFRQKAEADAAYEKEYAKYLATRHIPIVAGKFVRPDGDAWADHARTVREHNLFFNPEHHAWFDGEIAEQLQGALPAVVNQDNPDYAKYAPLRFNLSVLRNFLYDHFFPDGHFNYERDAVRIPHLMQMGHEVASMLRQGVDILPDAVQPNAVALSRANQEGVGAAELYARLYDMNQGYNAFAFLHGMREAVAEEVSRNWELPPIEKTPFSRLQQRSDPSDINAITQNYQGVQSSAQHEGALAGKAKQVQFAVEDFGDKEVTAQNARKVEQLDQAVKTKAVRIAKDIIDHLKIQCAAMSVKELIDSGDIPLIDDVLRGVQTVADTFFHHLQIALKLDPRLKEDKDLLLASEALGVFEYQSKRKAVDKATIKALVAEQRGDKEQASALRAEVAALNGSIAAMPESYKTGGALRVSDLLSQMEKGMDKVVARMQEMTQASLSGNSGNALSRDFIFTEQQQNQTQNASQQQQQMQQSLSQQQQQQQQQVVANAAKAIEDARQQRRAARANTREQQQQQATQRQAVNSNSGNRMGGDAAQNTMNLQAQGQPQQGQPQQGQGAVPPEGVQQASLRATTAAVGRRPASRPVRVQAQVAQTLQQPLMQPQAPQQNPFGAMVDPSLFGDMKNKMQTVSGKETSTALAPNSPKRAIEEIRAEKQEQERATRASARQEAKTTQEAQNKAAHDREEHEAAEKRKSAQKDLDAAQLPPPVSPWKKPSLTR
jgi:hypothetical protein